MDQIDPMSLRDSMPIPDNTCCFFVFHYGSNLNEGGLQQSNEVIIFSNKIKPLRIISVFIRIT